MKINKKIIIILIIIISVFLFWFISSKEDKDNLNKIIVPLKPTIDTKFGGVIEINNTYDKSRFLFPENLPTITLIKKNVDKAFVQKIKNRLNISEEIQEFNDSIEGLKYFANSKNNYLIVTPKTAVLKYGLSTSDFPIVNSKKLNDDEFINIAENFIDDNEIYQKNQLSFSNIQYLKRSLLSEGLETCRRDEAEIYAVSFSYNSSQYEIANNYDIKAPIYVELLKNGEIYSTEILLIEDYKQGITNYPIKNYQEFSDRLKQSKLMLLEGDYYSVSDIKSSEDIKEILVNNVKIAYYNEGGDDNYLQPIFIIEASITIKNSASNKAVLYLPAYK
jgi:hypothetical protein